VVLTVVAYDSSRTNDVAANIGWVVLWASGVFGVVPIYTLRRYGGVPRGQSYVHTTFVVDRGIYAVVRHPQYLAGILLGLGLSLVAQHWAVTLLGLLGGLASYLSTFDEEHELRARFGLAYDAYCRRVPCIDAATGLLRYLRQTR
jgi:protein-S-isoprenylcysteine O-methyltransferase Ste14